VVVELADTLGAQQRSLLDLPGQYGELAVTIRNRLADDFAALDLLLTSFYVNSITPTDETSKAIDERGAMGAIGDLDAYLKFKSARALGDAANNAAGAAGAGGGLGAGIGLGAGVAGMLGQALGQPQAAQPASPAAASAPAGQLTRGQVQEAIDALDLRFSKGEISEDAYNRLMQKWERLLGHE